MRSSEKVRVATLKNSPLWMRQPVDDAVTAGLTDSLKRFGQLVPLITHKSGLILDGHRRARALKLLGEEFADCVVLDEMPSDSDLLGIQFEVDFQRTNLSAMERSNLLAKRQALLGCSVSDLAKQSGIGQPLATKLLSYQKLSPAIQQMLHEGQCCMERAYIIAQEPDHSRQLELAKDALTMSREALRRRKNQPAISEPRAAVARFALAGGTSITVQAKEMTLGDAIAALVLATKELRKGESQGLDISTQQRVMRDRAKVTHA